LLLGPSLPLSGQTELDKVLAGYYEAIGGVEAWREVETLRMVGRLVLPGSEETPFSLVFARPGRSRLEYTVRGRAAVQAFDGRSGWVVMPVVDSEGPVQMTPEQNAMMREQADFEGPLIGWKSKGHQVELLDGPGDGPYRLRVTLDSGAVREFLLDRETYLPVAMETTARFEDEEFEIETLYGEYRRVGEIVLAHSVESRPQGSLVGQRLLIDAVELDPELDETLFSVPGSGNSIDQGPGVSKREQR
jgi:hypothetical protein